MQIEVLVERSPSRGYRATSPIHPEVKAEAETEDAAIRLLSDLLKDAHMVTIDIPV